jgi:hypothetical protein
MSPDQPVPKQGPADEGVGLTDPRIIHPGTFDPLAGIGPGIVVGEIPEAIPVDEAVEEHPLRNVSDTELPLLDGDGP